LLSQFWLKDKSEALAVIEAAITEMGRSDMPYSFRVVTDQIAGGQIVFFDLQRVSPLQFNVTTGGIAGRQQLVERIKAAIVERVELS